MRPIVPQRLDPFRGRRLELVGWAFEFYYDALALAWVEGQPCALGCRGWADLVIEVATSRWSRCMESFDRSPSEARLRAAAMAPNGDGLVAIHDHVRDARLFTQRGGQLVGERYYLAQRCNTSVVTNGQVIVASLARSGLWRFADWTLAAATPWPLDRLGEREPAPELRRVIDLGDSILLATKASLSRWTWDAELLDAWPMPQFSYSDYEVIAWRERAPILYMNSIDQAHQLIAWELETRRATSLGPAVRPPRGACSSDGRWLVVDRVSRREGRGLELWDLQTHQLVERLRTKRRRVLAMAFAPDSLELAVATERDVFVMRVLP